MSDILCYYTKLCKVIDPTLISVAEVEMLLCKQPYQSIKRVNSKDVNIEIGCGTNSYAITVYNVLSTHNIYYLRIVKTCVQIMQQTLDSVIIKKRASLFLGFMKNDFQIRSRNIAGGKLNKGMQFKSLSDDQKSALKKENEAYKKLVDQVMIVFKAYQLKHGI